MKVITLETVKTFLGLSDTTYDAQITAQIPFIDAAVKQICNNNFSLQIYCGFTSGSKTVKVFSTEPESESRYPAESFRWPSAALEQLLIDIPTGTMLEGSPVPSGAYIEDVFYSGDSQVSLYIPSFTMSSAATATEDAYIYAGMNIAQQRIIAKGIWWAIGQVSTGIQATDWKSRNVGPLHVTRSDMDAKIDGKSGMPAWFVKAMPRYHS